MLETLKHESIGELVKVAKYLTGFSQRNEATDYFDADFVSFICTWQGEHGLTADGVIGAKTWSTIAASAQTVSTSKNKKSAYACAVQILVGGGLVVDGIFGSNTKKAVAAFQSASGLKADGIVGQKTWAKLIGATSSPASTPSTPSGANSGAGTGAGQTVSGSKVLNNCVHYLQWDKRWKSVMFSNHGDKGQTIGNSGCGPSSMAMIMATFIDSAITPVEMCKLAVDRGHRSYNSGTNWSFFKDVFSLYDGFEKYITTKSVETLKAGLAEGALAVTSMNSNDNHFWTTGGWLYGSLKTW